MPRHTGALPPRLRRAAPAATASVLAALVAYLLVAGPAGSAAEQVTPAAGTPLATPSAAPSPTAGPRDAAEPADLPALEDSAEVPGAQPIQPALPAVDRPEPYEPPPGAAQVPRTRDPEQPPPPPLPAGCSGNWQYEPSDGPVLGWGGPLLRFHVAVEYGLPITLGDFTAHVDRTLGDGRSWSGSGTIRLQHATAFGGADFTIYLACPWTAYNLCRSGGVDIRVSGYPYTSCRVGNLVVINADRYIYNANAVVAAGGDLTNYRYYLINHEVGHRLGHDHVHCPQAGTLAPVMQQQTLRMENCIPNGWPYPSNAPGNPPTTPPAPIETGPTVPPRTRDVLGI